MKYFILLSAVTFIFSSCKKHNFDKYVYVSGHYYDSCNGQPVKNQALSIFQFDAYSSNGGILGSGSTDSTGFFKIQYAATTSDNKVEIRLSNTVYSLIYLHSYPSENIDNLNIYTTSKCDIIVKLNVINPYTNMDTLEIGDARSPGYHTIKIAGPFTNGILYTAYNFEIL